MYSSVRYSSQECIWLLLKMALISIMAAFITLLVPPPISSSRLVNVWYTQSDNTFLCFCSSSSLIYALIPPNGKMYSWCGFAATSLCLVGSPSSLCALWTHCDWGRNHSLKSFARPKDRPIVVLDGALEDTLDCYTKDRHVLAFK